MPRKLKVSCSSDGGAGESEDADALRAIAELRGDPAAATDDRGASDSDSSAPDVQDDNDACLTGDAAGAVLLDMLIDMTVQGTPMSAKAACIVAWWASRAGAQGAAGRLALSPTSQTGQFSMKFNRVAGLDNTSNLMNVSALFFANIKWVVMLLTSQLRLSAKPSRGRG